MHSLEKVQEGAVVDFGSPALLMHLQHANGVKRYAVLQDASSEDRRRTQRQIRARFGQLLALYALAEGEEEKLILVRRMEKLLATFVAAWLIERERL
jgi:hypothetical protein